MTFTELIEQGRYREAAEKAKATAEAAPANRPMSPDQRNWYWFLMNHTVDQIEAYMADPAHRRKR